MDPRAPDDPPDDAPSDQRNPGSPPPTSPPPAAAAGRLGASAASWTPPDAATTSAATAAGEGVSVEVEDVDGPPMPPPARRRRNRRRALVGVAAALVIAVPVGLAVAGLAARDDVPTAADPEQDETSGADEEGDPDTRRDGAEDGDTSPPPDLDALDGADAVYARLLVDIDASERIMMNFQDEVATAFSGPAESPDALVESLRTAGGVGRDDLQDARERFDDSLDEPGAEEIRERYLAHLDAWVDYMDAVSEDAAALSGEGPGAGFTVVINATADAFARALEERLPDETDATVSDYADDLLERGFRGGADAQV